MNDRYQKFIQQVDLRSINVDRLNLSQNKEVLSINKPVNVILDFKVGEFQREGIKISIPFLFLCIAHKHEENIKLKEVQEDHMLFKADFGLELTYYIDLKDQDEEIEEFLIEFAKKNVPVNAWPYARELVSNLTTRMGFPPLLIPPYNYPEYY